MITVKKLTATVAAIAVSWSAAGSATAATSPPGRFAHKVKVRVTHVVDGDTIEARTRSGKKIYIRTAGINTPEKHRCGYARAERLLTRELRRHKRTVDIRFDQAQYARNRSSGRNRLSAYIYAGGRDTARTLLAAGVALPFNFGDQTRNQDNYGPITERAALNHRGLFGSLCSPTAVPAFALILKNSGSASDYSDRGLYLRNTSAITVNLTGWSLKVGGRNERELPPGTVLGPGQELKVLLGGTPRPGLWLWNSAVGQLPVWGQSKYAYGGAYLSDPHGRIQSWTLTPCQLSCDHTLDGALRLDVVHSPPGADTWDAEYVTITNTSGQIQDLSYVVVRIRSLVHQLPYGTTLQPQGVLYIHPGNGKNRGDHIYLNQGVPLPGLPATGIAYAATHNSHFIDCFTWGVDKCPAAHVGGGVRRRH